MFSVVCSGQECPCVVTILTSACEFVLVAWRPLSAALWRVMVLLSSCYLKHAADHSYVYQTQWRLECSPPPHELCFAQLVEYHLLSGFPS